jgi:hypothetical protein
MMGDSRKRRRKRRALAEETQRSKGGPEVVAVDAKIDDDGKREREREREQFLLLSLLRGLSSETLQILRF